MLKATSRLLSGLRLNAPALLIDEGRARANIRAMAAKADRAGAALRPHFKTHQSLAVGRWFAEASVLSGPLFERLGFRQTGVELAARDGVGFERYLMARQASDAAAPAGSP